MLKCFTLEESEIWDATVRSFKDYDVYWLSGYTRAFQIHGDGEPLLFYYEDESVRGINVVMKRDVASELKLKGKVEAGNYYDFTTPYGYGGWLIEGSDSKDLFDSYDDWCKKHGIVCEFVRFHPVLKNHEYSLQNYEVIPLGNTVALDLSSPEAIWENITSKNRNVIRKAQKNGIKIYNGRYPEIFETFREIYNSTMDKDHAEEYYYFSEDFYKSICEDLPSNAQVFYAELDGKVIAASIMLNANERMNYHLSGSVRELAHLAPSNLLLYEAALWGSANGCKTFYLGGGVGSGEDSLFKFKKAFFRKDELYRFHIGRRVLNQDIYDELVDLRIDIPENSQFFPRYRSK